MMMSVPEPLAWGRRSPRLFDCAWDVRRDLRHAAADEAHVEAHGAALHALGVTSSRRSPGTGHFWVVPTGTSARDSARARCSPCSERAGGASAGTLQPLVGWLRPAGRSVRRRPVTARTIRVPNRTICWGRWATAVQGQRPAAGPGSGPGAAERLPQAAPGVGQPRHSRSPSGCSAPPRSRGTRALRDRVNMIMARCGSDKVASAR